MKDVTMSLHEPFRRCMRHYVEELKDRDDYEARMIDEECMSCRGLAKRSQYRILGEENWKPANTDSKIDCLKCSSEKELDKIFEENKMGLREQWVSRFEQEYWFIPEDLKQAGFRNFKVNKGTGVHNALRSSIDYARTFADMEPESRHNLLIMGNPGTGKTHLATAIVRTLKEQGFLVGLLTTGTLLTKIKATYNKGASQTEEDIFKDLKKFELLVLDDLGSESKSKSEFDWSKSKLFEIVNLRLGKPTIYTSNFNEQHLPTAIGERAFSRLYNNTKFIELVTDDYRKNYRIS